MKLADSAPNRTIVDVLLEEQQRLTAVEKFSQRHTRNDPPSQEKFYRDLIPLTAPRLGEQYAFEVNLDACSGCKACVTACHSLNGLDENETWREVGILLGGTRSAPFQQTITTACHHCVEPGCLSGCPVEAYEKDNVTGIVRHLDDQCIGCQYCVMKCPYEVPRYSKERGIVRKCDMCSSRLSVGEAPACVQACPSGAIAIRIANQAAVRADAYEGNFLPDSPDPRLTIPTTKYRTTRKFPTDVKSGDHENIQPAPAHWPLVLMLVLTQLSVGIFLLDFIWRCFAGARVESSNVNLLVAFTAGILGLAASVFHLGRPLHAWRSFLGWRTSWLSREILCFGIFAALSAIYAVIGFAQIQNHSTGSICLGVLVVSAGVLAVFCSVMVYHDTRREFWNARSAGGKFFGTTLLLGAASLFFTSAVFEFAETRIFAATLLLASVAKLLVELSIFKHLDPDDLTEMKRSALLLAHRLRGTNSARLCIGATGGIFLPFLFLTGESSPTIASAAVLLCVAGELLERYLFFTAVAPRKMPGGI